MGMLYGRVPWDSRPISRIVQGLSMPSAAAKERMSQLLDEVFALGCNAFDMAHQYGGGEVERQFGKWLARTGARDRVFLITKGAHHNADRRRVTPHDITSDLMDSLARLQAETIDLYLLHRDDPSVPVELIIETLHGHQVEGRVRAFGASNWSTARIAEANAYARERGLHGFAASSPNFSLAAQLKPPWADCLSISGPEGAADREWYAREHMPLFVWSSMAGGFLTGRFHRGNLGEFGAEEDRLAIDSYASEDNFRRLERAEALGEQKGLTIPQVALAYVLSHPLNVFALVASRNGAELQANLAACEAQLTDDEMAWLDLREA